MRSASPWATQDLLFHQVEPRDAFGDRMLDLEARVDLEEVEAPVGGENELDRAGVLIADRLAAQDGGFAHLVPKRGVERGRRRLLDDLLVPALDRALALVEVNQIAVAVAKNLDLDVTRVVDVLLDEQGPVAEGALALTRGGCDRVWELGLLPDELHSLAATAGACFEQHGKADLDRLFREHLRVLVRPVVAGNHRNAGLCDQRLGFALGPHRPNRVRRRPDEDHAGLAAGLGERCVLGQEAVARMDRVGCGSGRRLRGSCRCADSFRCSGPGREEPLRRPRRRTASPRLRRSRPLPWRFPSCGTSA